MPMYQCFSPLGSVPESLRPQIAQEITQIHCEATGAPASFVHVVFVELPSGSAYRAGQISPTCVINASIRSGRTLEVRQRIVADLAEMWERITGLSEHKLIVALEEVEANTIMEEGLILPNPDEESEWFERNHDQLAAVGAL
jgi:phenylpyruvate tautomerase PptA (4-oxalocrotonate tautomerase family)